MDTLWQDIRYAFRTLLKRPGFAVVVVLTLALGIGANTTIFSIVNGFLIRPLPYKNAERLVDINETALNVGLERLSVAYPDFVDWRDQNQTFEDMAAYDEGSFNLTGRGEPERISGASVSASLFSVLGVAPVAGRDFRPEEDTPAGDKVVILSHGLWQRRFGADPNILGQQLTLQGVSRTVVGILPPGFQFPENADLWVPLALDPEETGRGNYSYSVVARLKPGVTLEQGYADIDTIARRLGQQFKDKADVGVVVTTLRDLYVEDARLAVLLFLAAVGFVLLIACANVANLMLARAASRQKEMAIRAALGARRWRVIRQLLTESILLALIGGASGLVLGRWGRDLLLTSIPEDIPFWINFDIDLRVLGFILLISLATGLIFGLAPALQASRVDLNESLKESGGRGSAGGGHHRLRSLLVVAEIALALVLLISAGLMMKGFLQLQKVDPGFDSKNVLTMRVSLPSAKFDDVKQQRAYYEQFYQQALERVKALPGVESASAVSNLPMGGSNWGMGYTVEGTPPHPPGQIPVANQRVVSPDYFRVMGIRMLQGRDFNELDAEEKSPEVVIVNETMVRRYWPGDDPIGKRLKYGDHESKSPWRTVVGVVNDVRHYGLDNQIREGVYVPHQQFAVSSMTFVIRTALDPSNMTGAVRSQIWEIERDLPVYQIRTMEEVLSRSVWQSRLYSWLFAIFAVMALVLAAVGVYGVISQSVTQRTHEIGIRMALGARPGDVLKMIVGHGAKLALIGMVMGLMGAFGVTWVMSKLLFGISATDPVTFAATSLALLGVAILASYIPARRATKVDPMVALRYE
ncbi:MAG: ABC transporter permease [Blastocatellia bacterium]|nr:ABC transporter permease [Blastocatellia bacterium]